jgi:hypothetical protein
MRLAMKSDWVSTNEMATIAACSTRTLRRLQATGFLREGGTSGHWIKVNPEAPRSNHLWHQTRTLLRLGRV